MVHFHGCCANEESQKLIEQAHVGGFIYYTWANELSSPNQVQKLSRGLQKQSPLPLFLAVDQEGGRVARLQNGFTSFSSNQEIASKGNPLLAEETAYRIGCELKQVGINVNFAPVIDVNSNPDNPIIGNRSFSNDPQIVTSFGKMAIAGYKRSGILCALKHFPGHGDVKQDSHLELPTVERTRDELEAVELLPFKALCKEAPCIMTGHILVPALDSEYCATTSKKILTQLLRKEMEYEGLIFSDSLVMRGLTSKYPSIDEAAIAAINAGCDVLVLGGKLLNEENRGFELTPDQVILLHERLVRGVKNGEISLEQVNSAFERILKAKEACKA